MERIAIIDLGTNTFHLLIAEVEDGKSKVILNDKLAVKIGQGGITKNFISTEAYERALKTLQRFREIIDEHKAEKVFAIATSAVRNARNGSKLIEEVKERSQIDITVISGNKEAELIYEGVKYAFDMGEETSVIMDIGGGSVEFIICNNEKIFWKHSFEIGGQRLLEMFQKSDPIANVEIQRLVNFLEEQLDPLFHAAKEFNPVTLIGSSGTFDTLCEIDVLQKGLDFDIEKELEYNLPISDYERICFDIISKNREERMAVPGMIEMRVDMIVVACILIQFVIHKIHFQKIKVCPYALKEGVLSMALKGEREF
jgi:exopolyphosphatase/guanosine-5'-triphosphate,3'-diphosphate pyrophosphatase